MIWKFLGFFIILILALMLITKIFSTILEMLVGLWWAITHPIQAVRYTLATLVALGGWIAFTVAFMFAVTLPIMFITIKVLEIATDDITIFLMLPSLLLGAFLSQTTFIQNYIGLLIIKLWPPFGEEEEKMSEFEHDDYHPYD